MKSLRHQVELLRKVGKIEIKIFIFLSFIIASCSSSAGIKPLGEDSFVVTRFTVSQHSTKGFLGSGPLVKEAMEDANTYCVKLNKHLQVLTPKKARSSISAGGSPQARIRFKCLTEKELETAKAMEAVKLNNNQSAPKPDVYIELKQMKELLDSNIITQEEFDAQKKKILSQ